jgi:hypothetical protein
MTGTISVSVDIPAYRVGMSTEMALLQVVHRLEKSVNHKEIALSAFLDIERTCDNTSFNA